MLPDLSVLWAIILSLVLAAILDRLMFHANSRLVDPRNADVRS